MKKAILSVIVFVICITAFAGVDITSGNSKFLKEDTTAVVVFDYSDATWGKEAFYEQWCGSEYANRVKLSCGSFILGFNNESTHLKIKRDDPSAKYRITVKVDTMEEKHEGPIWKGRLWGRTCIRCSGSMIVEEIASGEVVCTAQIDKEGEQDLVMEDRLAKCFYVLGKAVARMK